MKTVIVDADGLIALFNKDDAHAEKAIGLLQELVREEARILYPATAIAEATTTLQRKLDKPHLAAQIAEVIKENKFPIEPLPSISFWQVGVDGWSRRVIQGFRLQRTQDLYCGRPHPDSRQHQRGPQATAPQPA